MARILVHGPATVASQDAVRRLVAQAQGDGHDAEALQGDPLLAMRDADALVVILEGMAAECAASLAVAAANDKPCLALVGRDAPRPISAKVVTYHAGVEIHDWIAAMPAFYEQVRPFAGRLVRDLIPRLVKEAGHDVRFRALTEQEKPRFLKQKVLAEAQELWAAAPGQEKEEIGDLLEALEALIIARGYDRESLKAVKEAKRKRRGGFESGWIVESTTSQGKAEPVPAAESTGAEVFEI